MKLCLLIIAVLLVVYLLNTTFGKRLRIRASGTADEVMSKDAASLDGAKAYYNAAITKKKEEYADANSKYVRMVGKIDTFEKTLIQLKKDEMQLNIKINNCIDRNDDNAAKILLANQVEVKEKIAVLKENLEEIKKNAVLQKELVDNITAQLADLEAEKEKAIFTLETVQSTMELKADCITPSNEEEAMLSKVRDGIQKAKEEAAGNKIAYESSSTVQQQRLEKTLKEDDIDRKLDELKNARRK